MTQIAFCRYAGVSLRSYTRFVTGRHVTHPSLMKRLHAAIMGKPLPQLDLETIIASMHRGCMVLIASDFGVDAKAILATDFEKQRPRDPEWLQAARIRRIAMYFVVVERKFASAAALGRAIGCTKQNVGQALAFVEDWRESDPAIDRLITKIPL